MVSRIRSRLASISLYGPLMPVMLCVLHSVSLYDYCDVVWSPTTAKLNCLIERVYSKFLNKLPLMYCSFTLIEWHRYHTALQVFKSLHQIFPPYLHNIFQFLKDLTGHVSRNVNCPFVPKVFTNFGKKSFLSRGCIMEQFAIKCF